MDPVTAASLAAAAIGCGIAAVWFVAHRVFVRNHRLVDRPRQR